MVIKRWLTIVLVLVAGRAVGQEPSPVAKSLRELTASELAEKYEANPRLGWFFMSSKPKAHSEAVLTELMTRGDDGLQQLQALFQRAARRSRDAASSEEKWSLEYDLAALTALRHLQAKPNPLKIKVLGSSKSIRGKTRELPTLKVHVVNADVMKQPVWFTFGGNYRSGRLARWRIHVSDENGKRVPAIPRNLGMGGGVVGAGKLEYGEHDSRQLNIANYVRIRQPGKYSVQVMYHNSVSIADVNRLSDLDELVLVKSKPFTMVIESGPEVVIELTTADHKLAKKLISELEFKRTVKMIGGEYGSSYHTFISPRSAHGRILTLGKRAVPALIEALKKPDATFEERGWMVGILDSIMHERYLSPFEFDKAMPSYECRFPGGYCSSTNLRKNRSTSDQDEMVADWMEFSEKYIVVRMVERD